MDIARLDPFTIRCTIQDDTCLLPIPQSLPFGPIENASAIAAVISDDVSCTYKYMNYFVIIIFYSRRLDFDLSKLEFKIIASFFLTIVIILPLTDLQRQNRNVEVIMFTVIRCRVSFYQEFNI